MTSPPPTAYNDPPAHSKRFRFKTTSSRKPSRSRSRSPSSRSHRYHHRHHHRSKRRNTSPPDDDPFAPSTLDPDTAFRESLFDALADDEGASYWEGVYGQPIHTYPRPRSKHSPGDDINDPAETDNVNTMTDEEYVTYVRAKMWEKSHQHILEERSRRDEERSRRKKLDDEGRRLEQGVEEALKRGEERRRRARWKGRWSDYQKAWEGFARQLDDVVEEAPAEDIRKRIPWPVLSGLWQDVTPEEIERFFKDAPGSGRVDEPALLKLERVRWHPDKVQQKAGTGVIDEETMRTVTAVFQVIDRIWSSTRSQ